MSEFDQLTAAQLWEAARVLGDWIREERHRAEVEAEMLDERMAPWPAVKWRIGSERCRSRSKPKRPAGTRRELDRLGINPQAPADRV